MYRTASPAAEVNTRTISAWVGSVALKPDSTPQQKITVNSGRSIRYTGGQPWNLIDDKLIMRGLGTLRIFQNTRLAPQGFT